MTTENRADGFQCKRCGNCCTWKGYVIITDDEADRIASFLNMRIEEFLAKFAKLTSSRKNLSLVEKENGECIFFNSLNRSCEIYDVRPQQCKRFPLEWNFSGWEKECSGAKTSEQIKK